MVVKYSYPQLAPSKGAKKSKCKLFCEKKLVDKDAVRLIRGDTYLSMYKYKASRPEALNKKAQPKPESSQTPSKNDINNTSADMLIMENAKDTAPMVQATPAIDAKSSYSTPNSLPFTNSSALGMKLANLIAAKEAAKNDAMPKNSLVKSTKDESVSSEEYLPYYPHSIQTNDDALDSKRASNLAPSS